MKLIPTRFRLLPVALCLTGLAAVAAAGPLSVTVSTSISPDAFLNEPTFLDWSSNALIALQTGATAYGTAGTPGYYEQTTTFTPSDMIGTSFASWKGQANPSSPYDTQTGNMLTFGMAVYGGGQRFTMSEISFADSFFGSTDTRYLSTVGYGARMVGINYGADRIRGTADDIVYSGATGSASDLVDALFFSGFADQFFVSDPTLLQSEIVKIQAASEPFALGTATVTGAKGNILGSGSASLGTVPEPATLSLGAIGVLLLGFAAKRKR